MANGAVSWKSQRQPIVALSTSEAEYVAATECSKHMAWIQSFYFDIIQQLERPTILHIDNTSAIFTASGEGLKARSKHIDRRHHYIRQMIQSNELQVKHIPTDQMLADFLTKPLGPLAIIHALKLNNLD